MNIIARYIHGSADSLDCDAIYIVDEMPKLKACAAFCNANPSENRNLATISNGRILECYKGFPDEVNNALLATYPLHAQSDTLLITKAVPRDVLLKDLSVLRKLLMELRHTTLGNASQKALKSGFTERLKQAEDVDLNTLQWVIPEAEQTECKKRIAFQLGQALALHEDIEVYTKKAIADYRPGLKPYLYRMLCDTQALAEAKEVFMAKLASNHIEDLGDKTILFSDDNGRNKRRISIQGKEHDVQ